MEALRDTDARRIVFLEDSDIVAPNDPISAVGKSFCTIQPIEDVHCNPCDNARRADSIRVLVRRNPITFEDDYFSGCSDRLKADRMSGR